jgi:HK97 family phage prohead protease
MNTDVQDFAELVTRKSEKSAELQTKEFAALLTIKAIDENRRRITGIASTGDIDRYDEIIEPEAFRESLPLFMTNPMVLASHQSKLSDGSSPVVANIVEARITSAGLEVVLEFHGITQLGEEYWLLYSQKRQRALSVGFKPIEGRYENLNGRNVYIHTRVELLEISCVPVPANPSALTKSKQRKADFITAKKTEREDEKFLAELRRENPSFDKDAEEFAEALLGDEDDEVEHDFAELVRGEAEDFTGEGDNDFVILVAGDGDCKES